MVPRFPIVGMGASAGGLEAFEKFFAHMPADSAMAFVLVQHLDPHHASMLDELLRKFTRMPVTQVVDQTRVTPDHVYVIPPNTDLTIREGVLHLGPAARGKSGTRMPIDSFFQSLAEDQGDNAVCIVLSGTGTDGTLGLRAIKEHGGLTIAQAPESARYTGMPQSAIPTGLVDFVLPIEQMPAKLREYSRALIEFRSKMGDGVIDVETSENLPKIIAAVRRATGHDFGEYRQKTVVRRVQRRMQVLHLTSVAAYVEQLRKDPAEVLSLFKDLLIGVTHFFRDPEAFEVLARLVIPKIVKDRTGREDVRVWAPACATGEESYSLAILFKEEMTKHDHAPNVRIFAGDIDEESLGEARQGRYPAGIAQHVSPERLERFFTKRGPVYQVNKDVREMCIFSPHNLIKNPPFSRLDLISCRNFLIYLETELQARLMPLFHYALRPGGYLFLGPSESLGSAEELFRPIDRKHRIFQRKDTVATPPFTFPPADPRHHAMRAEPRAHPPLAAQPQVGKALEQVLLARFAPPSVLVNREGTILYISGRTGRYLEPAAGAPSANVVNMARVGLRLELRGVLHRAISTGKEAVRKGVRIETDGNSHTVNLIARPMTEAGDGADVYMIIFEEVPAEAAAPGAERPPSKSPEDKHILQQLEGELRQAKERLQSVVEELEGSNEELRSSNEELLSMNEELQSANEELQTSKEEQQSLNEELETVNTELNKRVEELNRAYSDLDNLFLSTRIATLFVDKDLNIKRFTPATLEMLRLLDSDRGWPIADLAQLFTGANLVADIKEVLRTLEWKEGEVHLPAGNLTCLLQISPYRTIDNMIDGVVVTFVDVTARKQADEDRSRLAAIVEASNDPIIGKDLDGTITSWNAGAERMFEYSAREAIGRSVFFIVPKGRRAEEEGILAKLRRGERIEGLESQRLTRDGRVLEVALSISPIHDGSGLTVGASTIIRDITQAKAAQALQQTLVDELDHRVKNTLAVVMSLASQTIEQSRTLEEFGPAFQGRMMALAGAHSLLSSGRWKGGPLRELVERIMAPLCHGERCGAQGDEVLVPPKVAVALTMVFHELATNAVKYGSLSNGHGKVSVSWRAAHEDHQVKLECDWVERDGPRVPPPDHEGFGSRLVKMCVERELDGSVDTQYTPEGLYCRFRVRWPTLEVSPGNGGGRVQ